MPGNKFSVNELWDGVKKSTSDAWNEASQGAANLLRQIGDLATKHLPMIAVILRIVTTLPVVIGNVKDLIKDLGKLIGGIQKTIQGFIQSSIRGLQSFVKTSLRTAEIAIRASVRLVERAISREFSKLPKTVQNIVKTTLKTIIDPIKGTLRTVNNQIQRIITEFAKIKSIFKSELTRLTNEFQKLLSKQKDGILKEVRPVINGIVKSIGEKVTGLLKPLKDVLASIQKEIKYVVTQVTKEMDRQIKGLLKGVETNFKALPQAVEKGTKTVTSSIDNTIKGVKDSLKATEKAVTGSIDSTVKGLKDSLKATEKRLDDLIQQGAKAATSKVEEVGKAATKTATQVAEMPKKVVAEVVEEVPKRLKPVMQEIEAALKAPIVIVQKTVDDVGKNVGKVVPIVEDVAKQVPKMASHLDDILKTLGTVGKTVVSMAPIIEGIAEQINFEEIFQRLERIEKRIDDNIWADILENRVRIFSCAKALDRIEARLGTGGNNTVKVDFEPVLKAIAALPKTSGVANTLDIAAAVVDQMPRTTQADPVTIANAVAAKIPKPDNGAIADAVAAKLPKPIDNTATLTKVIQDSIKAAPPGQTVSSDAIATAVAAKLSKPTDNNGLAAVVKTALAPSLQAIDAKLPDNGIFRVDQTGIANAVAGKLAPGAAKTDGAIAEILKQVQAIPGISKEQTQLITNAINAAKTPDKVTLDRLNQVVNLVNNHTTNETKNIISSVQNITVRSSPAIVNIPPTDLSPINDQLKDISKAIGVDQLKSAAPVDAEKLIKQAGNQQFAGGAVQGATTLAGLMAAFAAPQFFRSGSHRMGGTFDQSLMNPKAGKVKIDDAMGFHAWQFNQIDERLGMPTEMQVISQTGAIQKQQFRSVQDSVEEINGVIVSSAQDLEIIERYLFSLTQDIQKLMQICLQNRADIDVIIDDSGCKTKEVKKSHPTHIKLTEPGIVSSLSNLFQQGQVHYVARVWDDTADKNQKMERLSYDTQIAAMSNKFEFDKTNVELPLDKSRATDKPRNDELWRTYVSTMEAPPDGYVTPGNPIPKIQEIKSGNPKDVPKPTDPLKKLGK